MIVYRIVATLVGVLISGLAFAHGPTLCVGTITYSEPTSVTLDLRFGVGLLHAQVDPDDDAYVSDEEWTSSTESLRKFFMEGIEVQAQGQAVEPHYMELRLTDGSEIQVLANLKLPDGSTSGSLALPVLKQVPGLPPSIISVWNKNKMVKHPELLWFGKQLDFSTTP